MRGGLTDGPGSVRRGLKSLGYRIQRHTSHAKVSTKKISKAASTRLLLGKYVSLKRLRRNAIVIEAPRNILNGAITAVVL